MTAPGPVRVTSLFEAHLPVSDVARAVRFYRDAVGLEVAYDDAERGVAFVWAGKPGGFREPADEPSVIGWMPAAAVYFHDPDGHMLEYLAMLDAPPRPEAGIVSWSDWIEPS